jgi:hypothetical protein
VFFARKPAASSMVKLVMGRILLLAPVLLLLAACATT